MGTGAFRRPDRLARDLLPNSAPIKLSVMLKCGGPDPSASGCIAGLPIGAISGLLGMALAAGGRRLVVFVGEEVLVFRQHGFATRSWTEVVRCPLHSLHLVDADSFVPRLMIQENSYWLPPSSFDQVKRLLGAAASP